MEGKTPLLLRTVPNSVIVRGIGISPGKGGKRVVGNLCDHVSPARSYRSKTVVSVRQSPISLDKRGPMR